MTKIRFLCDPCLWRWESFLQTISSGTIWSTSAARALLFHCVFICRGLMCSTSFGSHVGGSCVYREPLKAHLQHWWPHSCSLHGNLEPSSKQRRNINKLWTFWCENIRKKKECTVWTCQVISSSFDNCVSKRFSCWARRLMDWHDLAQHVRHVCLGKRYRWLAKVVLLKFIMSVCLYSVMNYSQQAPLTSLKRAAKSVSVRL